MKKNYLFSFLFAVILLITSNVTIAQDTLTFGTNTSSSSTRGPWQRSDTNSSSVYSRNIMLFTATELASAGISSGDIISELQWEKGNSNVIIGSGDANLKLYLKNSSLTATVSDTWSNYTTGSTLVLDANFNTTNNIPASSGWMSFILTTPFVYTGGAIEIGVDWNSSLVSTPQVSGNGAITWRWTSTTGNTLAQRVGSSSVPTNLSNLKSERANTRIIYSAPPTPGMHEDFSSGTFPTGWSNTSVSNDSWEFGQSVDFGSSSVRPDAFGNTGEYANVDFSDDPDTTSLVTPMVSVAGFTNPRLTFYYITQTTSSAFTPYNRLILDYWNGASWTNITVLDTLTPAGWTKYEFDISTYKFGTDSVQFRFSAHEGGANVGGTGTTTYDQDMALDEVVIEQTPSCFQPTALSANALSNGIQFAWTENNSATAWEVEYGVAGFTVGTGTRVPVSSNPYSDTTMPSGFAYDWYVRAVCGPADSSLWSQGNQVVYAGAPLSGAYTIDGGSPSSTTNFQNFFDLSIKLTYAGVSGPVTVDVAPGTYAEQVSIGKISGSNATNTVTIDGGTAASTILTHDKSIRNSTLTLEGSSYITIKNMTIAATGGSDSWGIHVWDSAHHITIDSNIISMPVSTTGDVAGIMASNSETSDNSGGNNAFDITISNNTVRGGERGITVYGNFTASARNQNVIIHNNDIQDADDNGIYLTGFNNVTVTDNFVDGLTSSFSDGMYSSDLENFTITGNRFKGGDNGWEGLDNNFDNSVSTNSLIANNMFIGNDDGLYLDDIDMVNIFHNSTSGQDYGLYLNDQTNLDIRNNIFTSDGGDIAFYYLDANSVGFTKLDYNIYYTTGTNIARSSSGNYTDLAAFQAAFVGENLNSLSGDPTFVNPTSDLHVGGTLANDVGDNSAGITVDFDGDTRPLAPSTVVDIGADEFAPPACAFPGALGLLGVTSDSATVNWVENGTATMWQVQYDTAGFTLGSGNLMFVTDTFAGLPNLMAQTSYDWYVRAVCGSADTSQWSASASFSTTCSAYSTPFIEDWETVGNRQCWNQSSADNLDWTYDQNGTSSSNTGPSGDHTSGLSGAGTYIYIETSGPTAGSFADIQTSIDLSGLTAPALNFAYHMYGSTMGTLNIDVESPLGSGNYTNVWSLSGDQGNSWFTATVNLGAYATQTVGIRIRGISGGSYQSDIAVDDLSFEEAPSCSAPTSLVSSNLTATTADLDWTENGSATLWQIEYGPIGFAQGSGTFDTTSSKPFTLTGLTAFTDYEYYVRSICGPADSSVWSTSGSFKTLFQCPAGAICATYTAGEIGTEFGIAYPAPSSCAGSVSVIIPTGNRVDSVSTFYDMTAFNGAWMSEQGSYLYSPTTATFEASGNDGVGGAPGTYSYSRDGLVFANGATDTVVIELHAERSWGGSACDAAFNKVDSATWTTVVYYSAIPLCLEPDTLVGSALSTTSASISWADQNPTATNNYQVSYGAAGTAAGAGTLMSYTTNSATLTGLTPSTSYEFYVRAICGPTDTSGWSLAGPFATFNGVPYSQDFEGFANGVPNSEGWSNINTANPIWLADNGGTPSASSGPTGPLVDKTLGTAAGRYIFLESSTPAAPGQADTLISAPIITGVNDSILELTYWYHMFGTSMGSLEVWVVDSAGNAQQLNVITGQQQPVQTDPWLRDKVVVSGYQNTVVNIVFVGVRGSSFAGDMAIDDVRLDYPPAAEIGITDIINPNSGCGLSATESIEVEITNFGSAAQSNFNVGYSVNGTPITPETVTATLGVGMSMNYTFTTTANLSASNTYDIVAYTLLAGDADASNDTSDAEVVSFSNVTSYPYAESFESGNASWFAVGNTSFELGAPNNTIIDTASNGTQAWVTDLDANYGDGEDGAVYSPCFDFTSVVNPYIAFDVWWDIETSWDGAILQSSIDGGLSWQRVGSFNDPVNWFNDNAIDAIFDNSIDTSSQGWTGTPGSGNWVTAEHYLDGLGGQSSVQLRVAFASDGNTNNEGFAFDNVEIWDRPIPDPYYPIGIINTEDALGVADSLGVDCWISGTTVGYNRRGSGVDVTIVDMSTGSQEGIVLFSFNPVSGYNFQEGDSVMVHGSVSQFRGLTQFTPDSISIIASGVSLPQPIIANVMDESTEAKLINATDKFVILQAPGTGSFNMDITNGTDTITIRVDSDSDIDDSLAVAAHPWVIGDTVCGMIGVGGQFSSSSAPFLDGYQIFPTSWNHISVCRNTVGINDNASEANSFSIYPNPSNGQVTIESSGYNSNRVEIEVLDLNGRTVSSRIILQGTSASKEIIDLSGVAKGIYFVSVVDGNSRSVEKLIIK